jgi:hypothetical protein
MIWFACKQCGKVHGRPETAVGALIFCDCGHGNFVPWESAAAPPEAPPAPPETPAGPDLEPVVFEPEPEAAPPPVPREARPRRGRTEKRDPQRCFNHQEVAKTTACADCEESFCADCVVTLHDTTLCGPCKNFRARRLEMTPRSSTLGAASLLLAYLTSPMLMCPFSVSTSATRWFGLAALVPQLLALGLGVWALWLGEREGKPGSAAFAITGVLTAFFMCLLTILLQFGTTRYLF